MKKIKVFIKDVLILLKNSEKGQDAILISVVLGIIALVVLCVIFWPQISAIVTNLFTMTNDYVADRVKDIASQ